MPYAEGARLPAERASKLGHLPVVQSEWVRSLVSEFEEISSEAEVIGGIDWEAFQLGGVEALRNVWSVDGSYVTVASTGRPPREVSFIKAALFSVDRTRLGLVDRQHPHPLHLRDILRDSAVFHATVLPLRNIRTRRGSNREAVRHIIHESLQIDQGGEFYETLKWLAFQEWSGSNSQSPSFDCPHCFELHPGLTPGEAEATCPHCHQVVFLSDMLGFHLDMEEDSAPEAVASAYMLVVEHLMLFTAVRLLWNLTDRAAVSEALFIKDGPLTLRGQYSKLVPGIRAFLQYSKDHGRPVHIIGQEKSGAFVDHLRAIAPYAPAPGEGADLYYSLLTHAYVRREVYRTPQMAHPYGLRTNWGEKLYLLPESGTSLVLNVPTGRYVDADGFPGRGDVIGLDRILATVPQLLSRRFEGALFPIELANGIASMSSYPSSNILSRLLDERR